MKVRWQTNVVLMITIAAAMTVAAQSPKEDPTTPRQTQARGYWTDPSTGLMWAGKDNGKDVSWKGAVKYCRDLRLAGYSDWRLANMPELQSIYDKTANAPGLAGMHDDPTMWHVKGNLFLTGHPWANDENRSSSGHHYYFEFIQGEFNDQPSGFLYSSSFMRALCVRGSGK